MRRKEIVALGQRSPLSLVIGAPSVDNYISNVRPTVAPAGVAAAVALKEETVEVTSGGDWPSRPEGVSEQDLLNEWLRLHTPKSSVSGKKKKDGTFKRSPSSYSDIMLPKGIMVGDSHARQDVYATTLKERVARINKSSESRYRRGPARGNVEELVNPKASKYVLDSFVQRVSIWQDVVAGLCGKANRDAAAYDFNDRIEARQLEWSYDSHDVSGLRLMEAANDASVSNKIEQFVGPIKPLVIGVDVWEVQSKAYADAVEQAMAPWGEEVISPDEVMAKLEAKRYNQRRRELEEVFSEHVVVEQKKKFDPIAPAVSLAPVSQWREKLEGFYYNTNPMFNFRGNELTPPSIKVACRALMTMWNEAKGHKWLAMASRVQQYQYRLKALRTANKAHSKYQPISRKRFVALSNQGQWLPGVIDRNKMFEECPELKSINLRTRFHYYKKRKKELTQAFAALDVPTVVETKVHTTTVQPVAAAVAPSSTVFTEALDVIFKKVVADVEFAKAEIKGAVENALVQLQRGGFAANDAGILVPVMFTQEELNWA